MRVALGEWAKPRNLVPPYCYFYVNLGESLLNPNRMYLRPQQSLFRLGATVIHMTGDSSEQAVWDDWIENEFVINSHIRPRVDGGERLPSVLLVADAPGAARLLTLAFSEFGEPVEIRISTSWQRALQILDDGTEVGKIRPDAVVLDTDNLAVNGLDLLREIRESVSNDPPPVVIFSRNDDPDVVQEFYERGATAYLIKPGDYEGLADVVEEVNTIVETVAGEDRVPLEVE